VQSQVPVGQAVSATTDTAEQVTVSPTSAVDLSSSTTKEVEFPVYERTADSTISVGQTVSTFVETAEQVTVSPKSAVDLSSTVAKEVELPLYERTATSTISVGQSVNASVDTAAQVSVSPTSQVGVLSAEDHVVGVAKSVSSVISVGQKVGASVDEAAKVTASPTSAVDLSSTTTKEVELPLYERTATSTIDVGQSVSTSVDTAAQVTVSPTSAVDLSSSATKEIELPLYERTASSAIDVGQSVNATTDTSQTVSVSPTSQVGVNSSVDSEQYYSIFEGFTRDARWDSVGTEYTDLDGATTATAHIRADVALGDTGILMEHGARVDGLAVAVVTDEDSKGRELLGTERVLAMFGEGSSTTGTDTAVLDHSLGHRVKDADTQFSTDQTVLKGDWRDDIFEGYEIGWENFAEVTAVLFNNGQTTLDHGPVSGATETILPGDLTPDLSSGDTIEWGSESSTLTDVSYNSSDDETTLTHGEVQSATETTLPADLTSKIDTSDPIRWESERSVVTVTDVVYDSTNDETTIQHDTTSGAATDTTYFIKPRAEISWSADTGVGQCVLYEDGTPVDTDPIQNSRLCGGNDGTIGDEAGNGTRELGQNWSSLDYDYENTVYFADIYLDETTAQVVSEYKTEGLSVTPAIYTREGKRYGQDEFGAQTVDLGRVSSARAYVNINGDPDVEDGVVTHWGGGGDGTILYTHDGDLYLQVADGGTVGGSAECVVVDIADGAHIIEWTANIGAGEVQLWVDGVKEDTVTGWSYSGSLAGANFDGIGRQKSTLPVNRGDFSVSGGRLNRDVKKAETYEGATWIAIERTASSTVTVGQSVGTSVNTSSDATASPTSSVGVSSSATTEVDAPTTVSPSTVFTNLGSYTANWNDVSVDYTEMSSIVEGSAEVQAYYESGYTGVLMESGADVKGLALAITDNDDLLIMAGDGSNTLPSNGVAVASVSMAGYSSGTYKFGWSCSDNTEQVALYINGSVVDTGTFTSIHNVIAGSDDGGIKTAHGGGGLRNLGQGWTSGTEWTYNGSIDWCVVYPGDITPDVQQTNSAPNADLVVTDDPSGDLVVEADASGSSDPDNDSLTYDYDWGDGLSDNGAGSTQTHLYQSGGTYTVTLTVSDGSLTDQTSQTVTVSESSSGEVVHDFETSDEGWISVETGIGRDNAYGRNGSSWSYGGDVDSAGSGEAAYVEPPELSGGNKIESLTFHYLEEVSSYGGGVRLYDSSGSSVIGLLTDNPQWKVYDGGGNITQLYDGNGQYQDWIRVEVTFDWPTGTADVTYTNESTGTDRTETGVSIGGNGVEKIQVSNYNSDTSSGGNFYMWIDDLKFVPSTSTSGPSFSDGVSESFTKEGSSSASHSASWDGSAAPYDFEIYKSSSESTLIWSASTSTTSNSQSNYQTVSISDLTTGDTVYFKVTDANNNSSTTSVFVSVAA
jgi:hypothetical protein